MANSINQPPTDGGASTSATDSGTPSWGQRLTTIASLAGAAIGLVAALGFPAAIVQFTRLAVPIQFLTYDRALRAGVLPAAVLALLVALLWAIGSLLAKLPGLGAWLKARRWPRFAEMHQFLRIGCYVLYAVVVVPLSLLVFAVFLAMILLTFAAMLIWMTYPFVWERQVLGLPATIATVAVLIGLWIWFYLPHLRAKTGRTFSRHPIPGSYESPSDKSAPERRREYARSLGESAAFEMPLAGLYAGLVFGGWLLAALFTVRWAVQEWVGVELTATVTDARLRIAAVLFGCTVFAAFFSGFSAPGFASHSRTTRRFAWAELGVVGAVLYAVFAWQYSHEVYHRVPQSLGGGSPEPVVLEYDPGSSETDLARLLPAAGCSRAGTYWSCRTAHLLEARADNWVVTDAASPTARSIVVPRSSVTLVVGR